MGDFSPQNGFVLLVQDVNRLERGGILGDEGALLEGLLEVTEAVLLGKAGRILHELVLGDTHERVGELRVDVAPGIVEVLDLFVVADRRDRGLLLPLLDGGFLVRHGWGNLSWSS